MWVRDQEQGNLGYAVDVVLCVDVTDSMRPVLETVKRNALSFHERLESAMRKKGRAISQLRLKVIAFRDFGDFADDALQETEFFAIPHEVTAFEKFLLELEPCGGGDVPESGLEALARAINSPWERGLDRRRHVIVVFTDAPAHPLGTPSAVAAPTYPPNIPRTMDELLERWGYARSQNAVMENSAKRLVLFAPDVEPWTNITDEWNLTLQFPSNAGHGLEEIEMDQIIDTIVNSL